MSDMGGGDTVRVVYEGKLENGEIFESSERSGPMEFQIGDNSVIPAFEKAVAGMKVGEKKDITLQPEEAYGPRREELVMSVARKNLGVGIDPRPGMILGMSVERDGQQEKVPAMVTGVTDDTVIVDFNNPLAGRTVTFTITLLERSGSAAG